MGGEPFEMQYAGELAALVTALCWAGSALFFASAGERVGSLAVNFVRLWIGLVFLMVTSWIVRGAPLPHDATGHMWLWLCVSGIVGFTFGDLCLFRAFVELGPRLSSLVMSLTPPMAAVVGWIFLDEGLSAVDLVGMTLVVSGIGWAVMARQPPQERPQPRPTARGVLLAVGGALGQAVGLVLSKHGMGEYDAFAASQIRVIAGIVGFAILFGLLGWWPKVREAVRDRRGMRDTAVGAFFGPFLGVGFSLLAVQHTETGVAASIMAITPILIIPLAIRFRRERVSFSGVAGACVAVVGVVILFAPLDGARVSTPPDRTRVPSEVRPPHPAVEAPPTRSPSESRVLATASAPGTSPALHPSRGGEHDGIPQAGDGRGGRGAHGLRGLDRQR